MIAAGGRVRVALDGRQFRRSWERRLDARALPTRPAAVRTYDQAGDTRCVAFDLDAKKKASRAAVLRDCERLTDWLEAAGCAYFVDESTTGGRHVYVPLDHPRSHAELAPLARHLRGSGALPTLDPGPLVNLTEGCIRTPGSAHRLGGHQRLVTPLPGVLHALNRRTTPRAWTTFLAITPEPAPDRRSIDLLHPAADHDLGDRDTDQLAWPGPARADRPTQGTAGTPGTAPLPADPLDNLSRPKRPLAPSYAAIAVTGTYPADRYPSASEARAAVLLHALCRGWTPHDITAAATDGTWPGLATLFQRHYGRRYAPKALAADLDRAAARHGELPLHQIHTSATRPRAGVGNAARLHIRRFTAALELALRTERWSTARGYGIQLVLLALADAARRSQSIYPSFGIRHISMGTGTAVEASTVAKTLKALAGEDDPFILLIDSDRGLEPDVYELRIPDAYLDDLPDNADLPPAPIGVHPAFSLLPMPAYRLHSVMSSTPHPHTVDELAQLAHVPLRSAYATLTALHTAGLVRRRQGRWSLSRRGLTRYARLNGIAGRLHEHVRRWRAERNALRLLHGLEQIPYPAAFTVAWPGLARPHVRADHSDAASTQPPIAPLPRQSSAPPPGDSTVTSGTSGAASTRPDTPDVPDAANAPPADTLSAPRDATHLERAVGGGRPDWRTDLEEATALELLARELGATLLENDPPARTDTA